MIDVSAPSTSPLSRLVRWTVLGGLVAFALVASLLVLERFATDVVRSPDPAAVVLSVALCAALALSLRWPYRQRHEISTLSNPLLLLLPSLCLVLLGLAISNAAVPWLVTTLIWIIIAGEEGVLLWRRRAQLRSLLGRFRRRSSPLPNPGQASAVDTPTTPTPPEEAGLPEKLPHQATQSLLRTRASDGTEAISGMLRAEFAPGERTVYAHVGFCPPLAGVPQIEFEQTAGPEATLKLAQTLPHGARFDVRLNRVPQQRAVVELAFHATSAKLMTASE